MYKEIKKMKKLIILLGFMAAFAATSAAQITVPIKKGGTLPATCDPANIQTLLFQKTGTSNGLYYCSATNTWSPVGYLGSLTSANGAAVISGSPPVITIISAPKWTTARLLAGNSVDGSANVAFANKFIVQGTSDSGLSGAQFTGSLATGIVKNTTTTGVFSIASAGDFPTLNQNTTGSAATLTTPRAINGVNFDGSAPITVTAAAGTLTGSTLNSGVTASSLTSVGTVTSGTWNGSVIDTARGGTGVDNSTGGTANQVWARPNGSTGAATYRALVAADIPTLNQNTSGTAANLSGTPALPNGTTATSQSQADNSTKLATTAYVDTGLGGKISTYGSQTANTVLAAPDGSPGTPSFRAIVAADIPTLNQNTSGSAATATTATNLAGGSGGSIPYQTAANTTALLANGSAGQVLQSNGTTLAPSWVTASGSDLGSIFSVVPPGGIQVSAATNYIGLIFVGSPSNTGTEANRQVMMPVAGTLQKLYIRTTTTQDATTPCVITVRVNGVNTAITITISAGQTATTLSDLTHTASVNAGDLVSISVAQPSGLSGTIFQWAILYK